MNDTIDNLVSAVIKAGYRSVSMAWVNDGHGWIAVITSKKDGKKPAATARHKTSPSTTLFTAWRQLKR